MTSNYDRKKTVNGSCLTDATCSNIVDLNRIFLFSTVHVALIARYIRQAELVHRSPDRTRPVNVLDVGCNNGAGLRLYASNNFQTQNRRPINYLGVDLDEVALKEAVDRQPSPRACVASAQFLHVDITRPWTWVAEQSADVIWYTETIEHVPADEAYGTLVKAWLVAAPGAVMMLATPAPLGDYLVWPESHDHEFSREQMREMILEANWTIEDEYGVNTNWSRGRARLRERRPELFEQYELLRSRLGGTVARTMVAALAPEVCDDLVYICRNNTR